MFVFFVIVFVYLYLINGSEHVYIMYFQVLEEVEKQYKRRLAQKMGKMSDSLPSVSDFTFYNFTETFTMFFLLDLTNFRIRIVQVIIDEPKAPSAPRHGSDSSGFGSGKGEPTKVFVSLLDLLTPS